MHESLISEVALVVVVDDGVHTKPSLSTSASVTVPRLCQESRQRKWLRGAEYFHPNLQRTRTIKTVFNSVWHLTTLRTVAVD